MNMEEFEAEAFDLSFEGLAVVKDPVGFIFFVPGLWVGEKARLKIRSREKNYGYAEILEVLVASDKRVDAPCPHHGFSSEACGGCPWQFVDYEAQLTAKQNLLNSSLKRAGFLEALAHVESIVPSPLHMGYRNRASFKSDGNDVGFVAAGSNKLVPVDDCLVLTEPNRKTLKDLISKLPNPLWRPAMGQQWKHLEIYEGLSASDVVPNAGMEFQQANDGINQLIKNWLSNELEGLNLESPVLELFCGNGNFSEVFFSKGYRDFVGVELSRSSVIAAAQKFPGYSFHMENLYQAGRWKSFLQDASSAEILFLDPPREGFEPLLEMTQKLKSLQTLFYVSCNLQTWLRDVKSLVKKGWVLERLQPFDMFPQTPHMEIVSKLRLG